MENHTTTERQNFFVDYENQDQPVEQESAPVEQPVAEAQSAPQEPQPENFAVKRLKEEQLKLRDEKFRLEREKAEMAARLKQLEESQKSPSYDSDDLVQRGYVDQRIKALEQQVQKTTAEYKLKAQYPDFDRVVNDATISALKEKYPSLAYTIGQAYEHDQFNGAAAAYDAIKNMGIYHEDTYALDRERAQLNAGKPRMSQSVATAKPNSPIAAANAFSDELKSEEYKKNLFKEMMFYANQK